jgi:hypothetical protein
LAGEFLHPVHRPDIDGPSVHFVPERGAGPGRFPLVLTYGWPKSFAGPLKPAPLLTRRAAHEGDAWDSFDVVAPRTQITAFDAADRGARRAD